MTTILVALGAFLVATGVTAGVARWIFLLGFQLGRDDRVLDPGDTTGQLPSSAVTEVLPVVGESSGRHARIDWPADEPTDTERFEPVVRPEVRA